MSVVLTKHFYGLDYVRMEAWLDQQGQKGLRLTGIKGSQFLFEQTKQTYYYRLAYLGTSLNPSEKDSLLNRLRVKSLIYSCQKGPWAYFYSDSPIRVQRSSEEKLALLRAFRRHISFVLLLLGFKVILYLLQVGSLWTWKVGRYLSFYFCLFMLYIRFSLWRPGLLSLYAHYQHLKQASGQD